MTGSSNRDAWLVLGEGSKPKREKWLRNCKGGQGRGQSQNGGEEHRGELENHPNRGKGGGDSNSKMWSCENQKRRIKGQGNGLFFTQRKGFSSTGGKR